MESLARLDQLVQTRTPVTDTCDHVKMCDPLPQLRSLSLISPLVGGQLRHGCRRSAVLSRSSMPGLEDQV